MKIFAVNTIVHRDHLPVAFSVGDEVPEWAVDKVGSHCLVADTGDATPLDDLADADAADDASAPIDDDPAADDVLDDTDTGDVTDTPAASDAPDFTKPARRAPARKR